MPSHRRTLDSAVFCLLAVASVHAQSLSTHAINVGRAGGSYSVILATPGAWTAVANDPFLHIASSSGSVTGNAVIIFTVDAFSISIGTRTGTLTIGGFLTLAVTQAGTSFLAVSPMSRRWSRQCLLRRKFGRDL